MIHQGTRDQTVRVLGPSANKEQADRITICYICPMEWIFKTMDCWDARLHEKVDDSQV